MPFPHTIKPQKENQQKYIKNPNRQNSINACTKMAIQTSEYTPVINSLKPH